MVPGYMKTPHLIRIPFPFPGFIPLLFLFQFFSFGSSAQSLELDSLVAALPTTANDTARARMLLAISEGYQDKNSEKAIQYARLGLLHVTQVMHWRRGIAVFNNVLGNIYSDRGIYDTAMLFYTQAFEINRLNLDSFNIASNLNNIANCYSRQSLFLEALEKYHEALAVAENIQNNGLITLCLNNIGSLYFLENNFAKGMEYHFKALDLLKKDQDYYTVATTYESIGSNYAGIKDTSNAMKFYQAALDQYSQIEDRIGLAKVYGNMSVLLPAGKSCLEYRLKAQAIWDELYPGHNMSITNLVNLAWLYLELGRKSGTVSFPEEMEDKGRKHWLQLSKAYLDQAHVLQTRNGGKDNEAFLSSTLSEWAAETGDYATAYLEMRKAHAIEDSLFSQEHKNRIAGLENQRTIALKNRELAFQQLALSAQKKQRIGLLTGLLLTGIIAVLLFRQSRIRSRNNEALTRLNQQLDAANQVKTKLFSILGHDLRQPVARLLNFLHLQREAPDLWTAAQKERHQTRITQSAENLLEQMESLLLWSKSQMEHFEPVQHHFQIETLLEKLERTFSGVENVHFSREIHPEASEWHTDEHFLYSILYNLSANAVKALEPIPNGKIHLTAGRNKSGKLQLEIADNGPGLSTGKQKPENSKSGLGQYIISDLAAAIRCQVKVAHTGPEGTVIQLEMEDI